MLLLKPTKDAKMSLCNASLLSYSWRLLDFSVCSESISFVPARASHCLLWHCVICTTHSTVRLCLDLDFSLQCSLIPPDSNRCTEPLSVFWSARFAFSNVLRQLLSIHFWRQASSRLASENSYSVPVFYSRAQLTS